MASESDVDEDVQVTPDAILEYHRFISQRLEPTLRTIESERAAFEATAASCRELAKLIDAHAKTGARSMDILVDVGERCMMKGTIPDPSLLVVDTGCLGLRVEMSPSEAQVFALARAALLDRRVANLEAKANGVAGDISQAKDLLERLKLLPLES